MKKLLIAGFAAASALALGAAEYVSVSFSTVGPDKYADGETVLDGECYALVASTGAFGGFNVDGTLKSATDKLLVALPLANKGKCDPVVFNIDETLIPAGSKLGLYVLDTRKFVDGVAQVQGLTDGKLTFVNAFEGFDAEVVSVSAQGVPPQTAAGDAADGANSMQSALIGEVPTPVITDMKDFGDVMMLTVDKTVDFVNYQVVGGETFGSKDVYGETKLGGGDGIKLAFPKNGRKTAFIQVIRK